MNREYHSWHSPNLGIQMPVVSYGHYGPPLLMFPTAAADCEEYERFGLIGAIAHHIEAGRVKVYSINSINQHSWMNKEIHPAERARRQALFDSYVYQEVAPFIEHHCQTPGIGIGVTGASFGAFHSMNTLLKHPDRFRMVYAMSGMYDVRNYADGYYDDNIYFNNPADYIPNLNDPHLLHMIRTASIHVVTGQGAWENPDFSRHFSWILSQKDIPHNLELWGYEWPHDWPTWKVMLDQFLGRL